MTAPRVWTIVDKNRFTRLWLAGEPLSAMAERFNFTRTTVTYWARKFGLPKRDHHEKKPAADVETRLRHCMNCHKPFHSHGNQHRMCTNCRGISVSPFEP